MNGFSGRNRQKAYYVIFYVNEFFKSINKVHQYQTKLASKISNYLPEPRTNYGKFNIRVLELKFGIPLKSH